MDTLLKNLDYGKVLKLKDQVTWLPGQITSKTITQNPAVGITLFAIPKDEGISAHKSSGDAFVLVLEGKLEVTIESAKYNLNEGDSIIMPAGKPHAVDARENAKMFLVVVFPA